jgi:hypothetical protein
VHVRFKGILNNPVILGRRKGELPDLYFCVGTVATVKCRGK